MKIVKTPLVETKYKQIGYYITVKFMLGDADNYENSDYFFKDGPEAQEKLISFLYMLQNIDHYSREEVLLIDKVAPDFEWSYDMPCDQFASVESWDIVYSDGKELFDVEVDWIESEVPEEVRNMLNRDEDEEEDE